MNSNRYKLNLFLLGIAVVIAGIIGYTLLSWTPLTYSERLFRLGTVVVIAGIIGYTLLSWKQRSSTLISHGVTWTPITYTLAFAVILIVTLAIGAIVYLPHPP